jgi:hypothetical protein
MRPVWFDLKDLRICVLLGLVVAGVGRTHLDAFQASMERDEQASQWDNKLLFLQTLGRVRHEVSVSRSSYVD